MAGTAHTKAGGGLEAEAWIVGRVTEHDHGVESESRAAVQSPAHQSGADALVPMWR